MKVTKKAKIGKNLTDVALLALGIVGGSFVSGAAYEGALRKAGDSKTIMLAKRGTVAAIGIAGATAIDSDDEISKIVKGMGMGMAVRQIFDGAKEAMATSPTATTLTSGTKAQRAIAAGIGLGCPCDGTPVYTAMPMLNRPARKGHNYRRGMKGPGILDVDYSVENPLQKAIDAATVV